MIRWWQLRELWGSWRHLRRTRGTNPGCGWQSVSQCTELCNHGVMDSSITNTGDTDG